MLSLTGRAGLCVTGREGEREGRRNEREERGLIESKQH